MIIGVNEMPLAFDWHQLLMNAAMLLERIGHIGVDHKAPEVFNRRIWRHGKEKAATLG